MKADRAIAVYCGSRSGNAPIFKERATAFGVEAARRGFDVVYGGARDGIMGAVADAVLAGGRRVIGVIPKGLDRVEFAHPRLSERVDVATMHARKAEMAVRAVAFVALPGGFGTLDELFEVITWRQLGHHTKPVGLLDVDGYFQPLLRWVADAVRHGFAPEPLARGLIVSTEPGELLTRLDEAR